MSESGKKFRYKIAVVGDVRVGKTSLITKYTLGTFEMDYVETIGAQFSKYDKKINGNGIRLLLWDIAGQRNFDFLRPSFYRDTNAVIIVCSLEKNKLGENSFNHIESWNQEVEKYCGKIPAVLFTNKVDLVDETYLDLSSIQKIVKKLNFLNYYITSAKTGQGVHEAFNAIIEKLYFKSKALNE